MPEYSSVQHKKNGRNLSSPFLSAEKGLYFQEILPCDVVDPLKQFGTVSRMLDIDIVAYSLSRLVPTQIVNDSTVGGGAPLPPAGCSDTVYIQGRHGQAHGWRSDTADRRRTWRQVGDNHSQTSMIVLAAVLVTRFAELCPVCLVHHLCFVLARDLVSW